VIELAEIAADLVPGCEIEVRGEPGADQRTYRASFGKFAGAFPDFEFRDAAGGAKRLIENYRRVGLDAGLYGDPRFVRLRWLNRLIDSGRLNRSLRWAAGGGEADPEAANPEDKG